MASNDPWELSSGLPLDGATATVTKAEFGYRNDIAQGVLFLSLTFSPDGGEDTVQSFSVGKGWDTAKKGAELVRGDGRKGSINDQTGYGKFITSALACGGAEYLRGTNGPLDAATWQGTRWELAITKETTTNPTTGVSKESSRLIAGKFLGSEGGKAPAASAKAAETGGLDAALTEQLAAIAAGSDSHDDFMAAAFEVEGVAGNQAAEEAVMATGKGSIWAKAQA